MQQFDDTQSSNLWDQIHGITEPEPEPIPEPIPEPEQEPVPVAEETAPEPPTPQPKKKKTTKWRLIPAIAAVLALAVGLTLFFTRPKAPESEEMVTIWLRSEYVVSDGNGNVVQQTVYTHDASGRLTEYASTMGFGNGRYTFTYDEDGNLLEEVTYLDEVDGPNQKETMRNSYRWDIEGNLVSYTQSWDGTEANHYEYIYGMNGKMTTMLSRNSKGVTTTRDRVYDSRGNIIRETIYTGSRSSGETQYIYTYDAENRLTSETTYTDGKKTHEELRTYHPDGSMVMRMYQSTRHTEHYLFFYDEQGNLQEEAYYRDGAQINSTIYAYDEHGQMVRKIFYVGDEQKECYNYAYDDAGRQVMEEYLAQDAEYVTLSTYDEAGNLIVRTVTANGETTETRYTYDAHGNCIAYEEWTDGELVMKATQSYTQVKVPARLAEQLKESNGAPRLSLKYTEGYIDGLYNP